ncbi:MAG: CCA tRNA nucleotidyltransferase [Spirochaetes bacterium]|nr:CCA tRNA nucleotidyltransferase [Spirochaetota bacterium]
MLIVTMNRTQLQITIPQEFRKPIEKLVKTFQSAGYECYMIGGSVRDLLLKLPVFDFDFATNARPNEVQKLFKRSLPIGIKHGTVTVFVGEYSFEVTTYRADGAYIDGRHPESVRFSDTLEEDVKRRDFTINGFAYDVINDKLIDYVNAREDLRAKIIRTIGNPLDRFREDGLRPYRACRLAAKLNFTIEKHTLEAISQSLDIAAKVSAERVRDELIRLLETDKPSIGFNYMRDTGLLALCLPELAQSIGVEQNKYHRYDIYTHSVLACDAVPKKYPIIRLAALLHDIGKVPTRNLGSDGDYTFYSHEVIGTKMAKKLMKRLKFSNEEIEKVTTLVLNHMFHYTSEWTDGAVRRFMRKVGMENIEDLFVLREADRKGTGYRKGVPSAIHELRKRIQKVIDEENAITVKDLDINGYVVMEEFNLTPGPMVGKILNHLLELVLDDPTLNKREILLEKAREFVANFNAPLGGEEKQ